MIDIVGKSFITKQGCRVTVTDYLNSRNVRIIFDNGLEKTTHLKQLRSGEIKNPYFPSVYDVGYTGEGLYLAKRGGKMDKAYTSWVMMLRRCYAGTRCKNNENYAGCTVDPIWHNFQNFAKWFYSELKFDGEANVDKDIILKGNKIYCPEFCSVVPKSINNLILNSKKARGSSPIGVSFHQRDKVFYSRVNKFGVTETIGTFYSEKEAFDAYKTAKECHIKQVAEMYKHEISTKCYNSLINFKVEITD